MALEHTGIGDARKLGIVQLLDVGSATIPHTGTQTADQLIDHLVQGTFIGNTGSNAFGNQLLHVGGAALEIAVLRTVFHGFQRTHTTIGLELTAIENNRVAGRLFRSGNQRTDHDAVAAGSQCLHDITRIAQTTIGNQGNTRSFQCLGHVVDGCQLGNTDTGYHTGSTDGARTDTYLYGIGTCLNQHLGSFARSDITHYNINIWKCLLGLFQFFNDIHGVTMSRVDDNGIGTCLYQRLHTVQGVDRHADTGSHTQTALGVLAGHRFVLGLGYVLISNQTDQLVVLVYHRQLLDLVLLQNLCGSLQVGCLVGRHNVLLCHHLVDALAEVFLETQVTIGHDAYQMAFIVHYRDTTDLVFGHQGQRVRNRRASFDGHGVVNHTVFGTLYDGYLTGLLLDGHVLVNDTDATFTGNGNGHLRFCNRIHCSRYKRNFQLNVS